MWWKLHTLEYDYFTKTGLKRMCASCLSFHEGQEVSHSHCDYWRKQPHVLLRRDVIKHNGRIPACEYYRENKWNQT